MSTRSTEAIPYDMTGGDGKIRIGARDNMEEKE